MISSNQKTSLSFNLKVVEGQVSGQAEMSSNQKAAFLDLLKFLPIRSLHIWTFWNFFQSEGCISGPSEISSNQKAAYLDLLKFLPIRRLHIWTFGNFFQSEGCLFWAFGNFFQSEGCLFWTFWNFFQSERCISGPQTASLVLLKFLPTRRLHNISGPQTFLLQKAASLVLLKFLPIKRLHNWSCINFFLSKAASLDLLKFLQFRRLRISIAQHFIRMLCELTAWDLLQSQGCLSYPAPAIVGFCFTEQRSPPIVLQPQGRWCVPSLTSQGDSCCFWNKHTG